MTTIAADTFTRTVSGGWGTADTGGAWTVTNSSLFSVSSGAGIETDAAGSTAYARLGSVSTVNADLTVTIPIDTLPIGGTTYRYIHPRSLAESAAATTSIGALLTIAPSGLVTLYTRVNGVAANPTNTGITATAGTTVTARVQVTGTSPTTIRAKAWTGSTEPDWQVTATDSTAGLQTAGGIALGTYLSSSATNGPLTLRWDSLTVTDTTTTTSAPTVVVAQPSPTVIDARASTPGTPGNTLTYTITPTATPITDGVWAAAPTATAVAYTVTATETATGATSTAAATVPALTTTASTGGGVFTGSDVTLNLPTPGDPTTANAWGAELNPEIQKLQAALNLIIDYLNSGSNA